MKKWFFAFCYRAGDLFYGRWQYRRDFGWTKTKGFCLSCRFLSLSFGGIKWTVATGTGTMSWWKTPDGELDVHPVSPRHARWTRMFDSGHVFSDCWGREYEGLVFVRTYCCWTILFCKCCVKLKWWYLYNSLENIYDYVKKKKKHKI